MRDCGRKTSTMETCARNEPGSSVNEDFSDKIKENDIVWSERWV
jgi:hypothetical protein